MERKQSMICKSSISIDYIRCGGDKSQRTGRRLVGAEDDERRPKDRRPTKLVIVCGEEAREAKLTTGIPSSKR